MKIWIDLTNSPHINFFKPFINKWKNEGDEVLITTRDLANTIALIKQNDWEYYEIGGHAGKNKMKKLLYFPRRVLLLRKFLKRTKPQIGISQSSFYSPVAGKLAGIPTVYMNDNEHAKGNYIAFKFATLSIIPLALKSYAVSKFWHKKFNIDYYPGIKEAIYLSQSTYSISMDRDVSAKQIYIRLEPWSAQYYKGKNDFMDDLILQLINKYTITILPRGSEQSKHYQSKKFSGVIVANNPIPLEIIASNCDLFIGAGGSMTRELAYLGVPTISVYQDELLEVDKYLIKNGLMVYDRELTEQKIKEYLDKNNVSEREFLYNDGNSAFNYINEKVKEISND